MATVYCLSTGVRVSFGIRFIPDFCGRCCASMAKHVPCPMGVTDIPPDFSLTTRVRQKHIGKVAKTSRGA